LLTLIGRKERADAATARRVDAFNVNIGQMREHLGAALAAMLSA
jgi:hypothetical protein